MTAFSDNQTQNSRDSFTDKMTLPKYWSVRSLLLILVLAFVMPVVVGISVISVYRYYQGRAILEKNTLDTASDLIRIVDTHFEKATIAGQALAQSNSLQLHDFALFHRKASALLRQTHVGSHVVLAAESGEQLVNTSRPYGDLLPRSSAPERFDNVFANGKVQVTDVFSDTLADKPMISIDVPVLNGEKVIYVLSIVIPVQQINQILMDQRLPSGWVTDVIDSSGIIAGRSEAADQFIGQKVAPEVIARVLDTSEGVLETTTRDGISALAIYSRSSASNWSVVIGIPRKSLETELIFNVLTISLSVTALLALGLGLVWFMGGLIARSVQSLTAPANALLAGYMPVMPKVHFREAEDVANAIVRAAHILAERTAERENVAAELKSANALRVAETRFTEQLLAQLPIGVALRKMNGDFIDANPAFLAILGRTREQLRDLTNSKITAPEFGLMDAAQTHILLSTGSYGPYEKEYIQGDGSRLPVQVRGRSVEMNGETILLSVAEDISMRRKAELRLMQSQKMDAIGQLTGGIAHDFNNMLGVIIGNLDLLANSVAGNAPAQSKLQMALDAALRGAALTKSLLSVARTQTVKLEPVELNTRLNELLPLISHTAGSNINVIMQLTDAPTVEVDPGGLASTVLNLVINARDAMPLGGRLTISTRPFPVTSSEDSANLPPGQYVLLSVTDTGTGMSPEVMAQALTPFFTTKERGRGTGLGLAMAHGFVCQCGGELQLFSEPGHGTTVKLRLPVAAQLPPTPGQPDTQLIDMKQLPRGSERILVVDDEIELLAVTATWLKELGYAVTPCTGPASALTAISDSAAAREPFALMITDVNMPGMNGFALATAARTVQPGLALLYISGFADPADHGRNRPDGHILEKPFRQAALAHEVRDALDQNRQDNT